MAIIKAVASHGGLNQMVEYVLQGEKIKGKYVSGINCNPATTAEEMQVTKRYYHKENGVQYYHYIQSFPVDEKITPWKANQIAKELAGHLFPGYEILIATHVDQAHLHSHILVNSVSLETGLKLQFGPPDLKNMKATSDQLCLENGLSICEKNEAVTTYRLSKYKQLEKADAGKGKSYLMDCANTVMDALETAATREEFINLMLHAGYETLWKDTRKAITFICPNGKKVRNTNLEKTFKLPVGKETMEHAIQTNAEQRRQLARAFTIEPAAGAGRTDYQASSVGNSRAEAGESGAEARESTVDLDEFKAELGALRAGSDNQRTKTAVTRTELAAGRRREADRRTEAPGLERAWYGGEDREREKGADECHQESGIRRGFSR